MINCFVWVDTGIDEVLDGRLQVGWKVFDEPWVLADLLYGIPIHGTYLQHLSDELAGTSGQKLRCLVVSLSYLLEQGRNVFVVEWKATDKQNIENDAAAPDVDLGTCVELAGDDLWSGVIWTPTACLQEVAVCHDIAQAKVGDFDMEVVVEQEILGLQISMYNLMTVAVLDGAHDLLKELSSLVFLHLSMIDNVVEELGPGVLKNHDDVGRRRDDSITKMSPSACIVVGEGIDATCKLTVL